MSDIVSKDSFHFHYLLQEVNQIDITSYCFPELGGEAPPGCRPVPAFGLLDGDGVRQRSGGASHHPGLSADLTPQSSAVLPALE